MNNIFKLGIDIGSTTVKIALLDAEGKIIYSDYRRHRSSPQDTLSDILFDVIDTVGDKEVCINITGSGSINLGKALDIPFVQEVAAVARSLKHYYPQTDVAIELGGEDAKIIYFDNGIEERMNGVCAGGTGSFIDQMAALLQTDAPGLNAAAEDYRQIYPIAARCGVFAKTDIQPLINEGATKADLAASIFQAVVNQTVSGLACGKPIRGTVAFLGGPLHFMPELKKAFIRTLKLTDETALDPDNSHLFAAIGSAMSEGGRSARLSEMAEELKGNIKITFEMPRLEPLFENEEEYARFIKRHENAVIKKSPLEEYKGKCYLGIDAGSTTTKIALIGESGELLYSFYSGNEGSPLETVRRAMCELGERLPSDAYIAGGCSTGYGEELMKSAFSLDFGEVETVAHCTAAAFFDNKVDCVLDIGGQDMKCIRLKDGVVDGVMLNEACSSGCGSFIENFAVSLGHTAESFSKEALFAKNPVDLGTRCTVFMNSNVKQAQKEGAEVSDISAGLAYSVIKNALYKVIKLANAKELGDHIVVQGGTFYNKAVLRALEKITGVDVVCPDISGIMGAFGAALIAKKQAYDNGSSILSFEEIASLQYSTTTSRCRGCNNRCMLTINKFSNSKSYISGNRCEKGLGSSEKSGSAVNLMEYKRKKIFDYESLSREEAPRGVIGIPRVLNVYENYPFWAVFFKKLGFSVQLSPFSTRQIYEKGMDSIPSESECYPAKIAHGHIEWLIEQGIDTIFYPCVFFERQETKGAQNHFNCPIVVSYSENIKNNVENLADKNIRYLRPFVAFTDEKSICDRMVSFCKKEWDIPESEVTAAVKAAWHEQLAVKEDIRQEGKKALDNMVKNNGRGIVLVGRPYHIDPEINHGIPELIASYGFDVFTEDSLPIDFDPARPLRVVDQWVYHSRLYSAAEFVCSRNDLDIIQLTSFGCGLDAVTSDQVSEILENSNKLYTLLKIDEVNNLGAVRIRIRSLIAAINMRKECCIESSKADAEYRRTTFTKKMFDEKYTLLAPQMSPIHFNIIEQAFIKHGFNIKILDNDNRSAIDAGLKYVNNDACYPSIVAVGQFMEAVHSGKYNTDKLALLMTQTGGCCRASNYVSFIRRALDKSGLSHIPVISLNANGMEKNEGFKVPAGLLIDAMKSIVYGDILMKCLYRVRPYEKTPGSANALHRKWEKKCIENITDKKNKYTFKQLCRAIVEDFDALPIDESIRKPRVGIVGEILVKYMPLANNHLVELLEKEGAEAVVPDLIDFFTYCLFGNQYRSKYLGVKKSSCVISKVSISAIEFVRKTANDALRQSKRFAPAASIYDIAEMTKPFLSLGNQYGEGWFLAGEMLELIHSGTPNIVCIQPFACLPNHVVGKGVIKAIRKVYPKANIAAVDYDPGASEVNQLNRIKLMLSTAVDNLKEE